MLVLLLVLMLTNSERTICDYCGKDFVVLGRHVRRCKARVFIDPFPASLSNTLVTPQEKSNLVYSAERSSVNLNNEYEANQPEAHTTNYDLEVQNEVLGMDVMICMLNVTVERNAKALEVSMHIVDSVTSVLIPI